MLDLSNPADRIALEELIAEDIDNYCLKIYEQDFRDHLGASVLAEPCSRKLWYGFRWAYLEEFDARMMRLFNVGHQAEPRFIDYLRGIGFEVSEFTSDGKQHRISGHMGHYGGSLDGKCKAPARYQIVGDLIFLNEYKTNNTGRGFEAVHDSVAKAKPKHWGQMCQYGFKEKIRYGIYIIENKNDSDLIVKVVELDWRYGEQLERKAGEIIFSQQAPARISENPAYSECVYCAAKGTCHYGEQPIKNCRSCVMAKPVEEAGWYCGKYQQIIPKDFIRQGCSEWLPI